MSRPHEPGSSPARDAVRQRTGARRNDDDEDGGRRNDDEGALLDGDEERAGDHDEDEGEAYEDEEGGAISEDEEEEADDEEVGGDSKESDRDREMHAIQGLPCVPIGDVEFPSRKERGKRLSQSFDHWNTRSWTGDVDLRNANLVRDWATGFCNSHGKLLATGAVAQPRDPRKMASVQKYAKGRGLFV